MAQFTIAVEGLLDSAVARRLCQHCGHGVGPVHIKNGKTNLDPKLAAYNYAATRAHWFVLRDLDHDADCAPGLIQTILPQRSETMICRIPVRSIEAWLLADRSGLARYLGIAGSTLPHNPELLDHPKLELVNAARRSRNRLIREDLVPDTGAGVVVGPGYSTRTAEFVLERWSPDRAAENSESLRRCLNALRSAA